ncbi:hypothetical protein B0H13DRAFT_2678704 [Mycena leptocephala]|nr:hypothetical protein B0H13DRAFT_2678704 [Mycena leptocephala]
MLFPFYAFCFAVAGVLAAQHNITVDDADPSISYAGSGWVETNLTDLSLAHAYNATFHIACPLLEPRAPQARRVAIYYLASYFCPEVITSTAFSFTMLALDASRAVGKDWASQRPAYHHRFGRKYKHFLDAFVYAAEEPDQVPAAPAGFSNVFLPADKFSYGDGWANSSDAVPSCANSSQLRTTSTANSTFSFNFSGEALFLNTLASPSGGKLSVSINDGEPEVFDTTAPTASCALLNLNVTSLVKRNLVREGDDSSDVQNRCSGKSISGTNGLDGATYRRESSGIRLYNGVTTAQSVLAMLGFTVVLAEFENFFL